MNDHTIVGTDDYRIKIASDARYWLMNALYIVNNDDLFLIIRKTVAVA